MSEEYPRSTIKTLTPSVLEQHRINAIPSSIYYIPHFISPGTQAELLSSLPANKWTNLTHRRLQAHPSPLSKSNTLLASPLPSWLTTPILPRFNALGLFTQSPHKTPNHCLINEYAPGEGIMPHEDGGAYWPCVATVSLAGSVVLDIYPKNEDGTMCKEQRWRVLQEPGSLLVTTGEVYVNTLHGIADVAVDEDLGPETVANWPLLGDRGVVERERGRNKRVTRTSLTFRDVLKVSNAGARILGARR